MTTREKLIKLKEKAQKFNVDQIRYDDEYNEFLFVFGDHENGFEFKTFLHENNIQSEFQTRYNAEYDDFYCVCIIEEQTMIDLAPSVFSKF